MKDTLLYRDRRLAPTSARHSPLALWHLLSLDAPTVATLWTWFIAHCAGMRLSAASLASMFTAVWLLYAADRLLDARLLDAGMRTSTTLPGTKQTSELELRHRFHHQHRRAFLAGIVVAGLLLAALLPLLPPAALRLYALLGALLISWFLVIHTRLAASTRLPKELAVGIFFPAAVFIPTVAAQPDFRLILLGPALLFGSLCTLNCVFLYAWEHPNGSDAAHWTTRLALTRLRPNAWSLVIASMVLYAALSGHWLETRLVPLSTAFANQTLHPEPFTPLAEACLMSVALLLLFDRYRRHFSAVHLRAAADLALLTPVLWLILGSNWVA